MRRAPPPSASGRAHHCRQPRLRRLAAGCARPQVNGQQHEGQDQHIADEPQMVPAQAAARVDADVRLRQPFEERAGEQPGGVPLDIDLAGTITRMPKTSGSSRRRTRSQAKTPGGRCPSASTIAPPDTMEISGMRQRLVKRIASVSHGRL